MQTLTIALMIALIVVLAPLVLYLGHLWLFKGRRMATGFSNTEGVDSRD